MKILELFSGTASFSNAARERGHKTFTVDNDERFSPNLCIDVMILDYNSILGLFGKPDVIWASPPCTCFSRAAVKFGHFKRIAGTCQPQTEKAEEAVRLVQKTLTLISKLEPEYWILENPVGYLRKMEFMRELNRTTVTYCRYGTLFQKPTDFWHNKRIAYRWVSKGACGKNDKCHNINTRWADTRSPIKRAIVPRALCDEILDAIEGKSKIIQESLEVT